MKWLLPVPLSAHRVAEPREGEAGSLGLTLPFVTAMPASPGWAIPVTGGPICR